MVKPLTSLFVLTVASFLTLGACRQSAERKAANTIARGELLVAKKDYRRAALEFRNAVRLQPQNADAYYRLALAQAASHDLSGAVFSLRRATELDPHHRDAQLKFAELMSRSPNPDVLKDGERRLLSAVDQSSNDLEAVTALAATELRLGKET